MSSRAEGTRDWGEVGRSILLFRLDKANGGSTPDMAANVSSGGRRGHAVDTPLSFQNRLHGPCLCPIPACAWVVASLFEART